MPTKRFKEQLRDWQVLHESLVPRLTDMPQLAADHAVLGQALTQALDLEIKQDTARSVLRDVNQQRKLVKQQGTKAQRSLTFQLKGTLGEESEKLIQFAVKPRQRDFPRQQRSAAEKAARAAAKAVAKAEAAKAAEKAAELPPPTPTAA